MYYDQAITSTWTQYTIPFTSFTDNVPACGFVAEGHLTAVGDVAFVASALGTEVIDLDDVEFTNVAVATNGTWPVVSNFEANVTGWSMSGGTIGSGGDYEEGGTPATTAPLVTLETASPSPAGGNYARFDYNTGTNAGLGYQYSYFAFSGPGTDDIDASAYNTVQFYIRGMNGGEVIQLEIKTSNDPCVPGANRMYYDVPVTNAWTLVSIEMDDATFGGSVGGCPFVAEGNLARINGISFTSAGIEDSHVDIDQIEFLYTPPCWVDPLTAPVATQVWYDGIPAGNCLAASACGGGACQWGGMDDSTLDPHSGTYHQIHHYNYTGWWGGSGYNIPCWGGPGLDVTAADTIEFWIKASPGTVDPVVGVTIQLVDSAGAFTSQIRIDGKYGLPTPVPAAWTQVKVPLCALDFATNGVDRSQITEIDLAVGAAQEVGDMEFYVDSGIFAQY
jgi:hypothetical protein